MQAPLLLRVAVFVVGTAALVYVSRGALRHPRSHGFTRFFAWEGILALAMINLPVWDVNPGAPHQLLSWALLIASAALPIHAYLLLKTLGRPGAERSDEALMGFEKTTALVTSGAFRFIRHPMYTALLLLAWGVFVKQFTWLGLAIVLATSVLLYMTARRDEDECLAHFGDVYRDYMRGTKRFIPFVV
jgi:protein-S-isoprenylcysteine O-methyltransferase Ste14